MRCSSRGTCPNGPGCDGNGSANCACVPPTVRAFHHPTPGFETGLPFDGLCLFTAAADVGGEAELIHGAAHLGVVVTFIQDNPWGCSGLGAGRDTGRLSTVTRTSFMSWRLAPSTARPTGTPWASVSRLRLTPRLPRSVGLAPVFFPTQGRFGHGLRPYSTNSSPRPFSSS